MPSWGIHLATANEVIKNINISDKNAFLIGNFMPDAERYLVVDFSIFVPYNISHFAEVQNIEGNLERLPNPNKFAEKYINKMWNPLVLGYLTHLLTDYYWNKTTHSRYTIRDKNSHCIAVKLNDGTEIKANKTIRRKFKHNDFYLFEQNLIQKHNLEFPVYEESLMKYIEDIDETKYNKTDFIKIVDYLNNKYGNNGKEEVVGDYKLYTEKQIEIDFNNSIKFILDFFIKNSII